MVKFRESMAKVYIGGMIVLGSMAFVSATLGWQSHDQLRFISFLSAAALASVLKVRLPGVTGAVSVLAIFVLVAIPNLSLPEAMVLGAVSMLVQCTWHTRN